MSLRMHEYPDGLTGLAAFCDVCGEQITEHGYVLWDDRNVGDCLLVHQARCDPGRPGFDCSMPLDVEIVYLAHSVGVDVERARKRVRLFAEIAG